MADVNAIRLEDISDPMLVAALRRWYEMCGPSGLFPREQHGFGMLVGAPEVMNGHSAVIATDVGEPLDFLFAYYGSDLNAYKGQSLVAKRFRTLPDKDVATAAAECSAAALTARQPIAHRVAGIIEGQVRRYDRLILPTVNARGQIDRLILVIHELAADGVEALPLETDLRRCRETIERAHAQYRLDCCG